MDAFEEFEALVESSREQWQEADDAQVARWHEEAEALFQRLDDPTEKADVRYFQFDLAELRGDLEAGLALLAEIRSLEPDHPSLDLDEGICRFHLWQFEEAARLLRAAVPQEETSGTLHFYRGLVEEFSGASKRADRLFEMAAKLDPDQYVVPCRRSEESVEAMLRRVVEQLPAEVRAVLDNVQLELRDLPNPKVHAHPDVDPLILGLYTGASLLEQTVHEGPPTLPERVEVFQRNVERICADDEELEEQLRITLLHEIGHHLGWDEDDLEERGLA